MAARRTRKGAASHDVVAAAPAVGGGRGVPVASKRRKQRRAVPIAGPVQADEHGLRAALAPLDPSTAAEALALQGSWSVPARVVTWRGGSGPGGAHAGVVAEIPRVRGAAAPESIVSNALEEALAQLSGEARSTGPVSAACEPDEARRESIETGLAELHWCFARIEDGSYRVNAFESTSLARRAGRGAPGGVSQPILQLRVEALAGNDTVSASGRAGPRGERITSKGAVAYEAPHCLRALTLLALDANRRLRFARITVASAGAAVARIEWDAVLPAELPPAQALPVLVEAVACARAATEPALSALADAGLARAWLDLT